MRNPKYKSQVLLCFRGNNPFDIAKNSRSRLNFDFYGNGVVTDMQDTHISSKGLDAAYEIQEQKSAKTVNALKKRLGIQGNVIPKSFKRLTGV